MPRPRFMRADPALQERLLDAAAGEFAEHGYDGASLNAILIASGLSKGAFYYYFDDKADLGAAVLERELHHWNLSDLKFAAKTPPEFWAELDRYLVQSLAKLRESRTRSDLITRLGAALARDATLKERCGPLFAESQRVLTGLWSRGQELGAVRTDLSIPALIAVVQATKMALGSALLPDDRGATEDELESFSHLYLDLIRRIAEPARPVTAARKKENK